MKNCIFLGSTPDAERKEYEETPVPLGLRRSLGKGKNLTQ